MAVRSRRLRKQGAAHLEITAFINLIVVLVPFLLSTAVFSRLAVIDLTLPAQSSGVGQLKVNDLQLEVTIQPDALELGDRVGGLIARLPNQGGAPDVAALSRVVQQIKVKYPDKKDVTLLAQPDTPYDTMVHVMDALREGHVVQDNKLVQGELFPNISIGDAPIPAR
ncbi:MAG: biopolymer transporter ExbD [Burkholderiales bacterium]|nr:biopolymer transporter ExbD [Burkholderiales bacterium]MDE2433751.1 biopolymer transporter ExbD [Burkholderiales bacterium]